MEKMQQNVREKEQYARKVHYFLNYEGCNHPIINLLHKILLADRSIKFNRDFSVNNNNPMLSEALQKIKLLLDKPVSPLTRNQIIELVDKQIVPADDLLVCFSRKYRSDLILHILSTQPATFQRLQYLLGFLVEQLLKFQLKEAILIWKLVLSKPQMIQQRKEWTQRLLKDALKNTNESLKSVQLLLLHQNAKLLCQWKQGAIFQDFTNTYCRSFIKYTIYLAPYPALLSFLFLTAENIKTNLIDNDLRGQILARIISFLNNTKNKQLFAYQNQCLKTGRIVLESCKTKINNIFLIHALEKILEEYLWNKPTREQAYKCKEAARKIHQSIEEENRDKMMRNYSQSSQQTQKPLLIEQVIDKANNYRLNNKVQISEARPLESATRSSFLKRGKGNGGGKSSIVAPVKSKLQQSQQFFNSKLDQLVESCFNKPQSCIQQRKQPQIVEAPFESSLYASTVVLEDDKQFCQISNLIDLAYQYKFGMDFK